MTEAPILCTWDGEVLRPANPYWAKRADKQFVIGEKHEIIEVHERSAASHRAYFAAIKEAHANLQDHWAEQLPTPEHLRKYALIKAGYFNSTQLPLPTRKAALDAATFVRSSDDYAIVTVNGTVVTRYTAKSQSYRSMPKGEFQESKDKVLAVIAEMIGTTTRELEQSDAA